MVVATIKDLRKRYTWVDSFSEGLAIAEKDGMEFHILPDGTPAYKERYDCVGPFISGTAWVQEGDERFHIRPDGTRVD